MTPIRKNTRKTKSKRKRTAKKKGWLADNLGRILVFFFLFLFLLFSLLTASYVIFFRTVFASELPVSTGENIVFEEPDPPVHQEPGDRSEFILEKKKSPREVEGKGKPKVAIIIDDMGYHYRLGKRILELPVELTYSFLPFAPYTHELEKYAESLNKTILLHLPLEPKGKNWNPGPGALYLTDSPRDQEQKFQKSLAEIPHAVGVNNHMGSSFTENEFAMRRLLVQVKELSLTYIDSYTTAESVGLNLAQQMGIKSARRHVFLDNMLSETAICKQLDILVKLAEVQGAAIGIGHPHKVTLTAIKNCTPTYLERIDYVDIGEVVE